MRTIIALLISFMLCAACLAQDSPDQFVAAGGSYNGYSAPNFSFSGLYAKRITGNCYSFSFLDIFSKTQNPFTVTPSITTGLAQELFKIGQMPIYGTTGVGISAGGENLGWSWTAGFAPSIAISKNHQWKLMPNVRVIKSSLSDWQGIFGVLIGWGK